MTIVSWKQDNLGGTAGLLDIHHLYSWTLNPVWGMLPVGKIKDPCHNQSVNGRLHYKNIWYDEIGKRKNLMYSDCGKHCALGKDNYYELLWQEILYIWWRIWSSLYLH